MIVLAIESSCDETAVAILDGKNFPPKILASEISSQIDIHRAYGGVVPEVASRNHTLNIRPLINQALRSANLTIEEIDGFAATAGPGLASSLLVGNTAAKALALAAQKPFLSINHMEGHLFSPFIESKNGIIPHLGLIVSGGHTMLVDVQGLDQYKLIGKTRDDAAGEAFDKVGKMLELPYPGGPEIERIAKQGNTNAFNFPKALIAKNDFNFSFSGLKTSVLYTLEKLENPQAHIADLAASFQQTVIETLVRKATLAAKTHHHKDIAISGGVSCNHALRQALQKACDDKELSLHLCSPKHSTDNAAMIAYAALQRFRAGLNSPLSDPIDPNLSLVS